MKNYSNQDAKRQRRLRRAHNGVKNYDKDHDPFYKAKKAKHDFNLRRQLQKEKLKGLTYTDV